MNQPTRDPWCFTKERGLKLPTMQGLSPETRANFRQLGWIRWGLDRNFAINLQQDKDINVWIDISLKEWEPWFFWILCFPISFPMIAFTAGLSGLGGWWSWVSFSWHLFLKSANSDDLYKPPQTYTWVHIYIWLVVWNILYFPIYWE